jgi:hypothetical protein
MSTTTDGTNASVNQADERVDAVIEGLGQAVMGCLAEREALDAVLGDLRKANLRGDPVQEDLSAVLERHDALRTVAGMAVQHDIERVIAIADAKDALPEGAADEFLKWWQDKQWLLPGVEAHLQTPAHGPTPAWTQPGLSIEAEDGDLIVEHSLKFGLDEVHRIQTSFERLFLDAVGRLNAMASDAADRAEDGDETVDDDMVELLGACGEKLESIIEDIERVESAHGERDAPDSERPSERLDETEGDGPEGADADAAADVDDESGEDVEASADEESADPNERLRKLFDGEGSESAGIAPDDESIRGFH